MKKIIKTCLIASVAILFANCTSDNNTEKPEIEKVYHISSIKQTLFEEEEEAGEVYDIKIEVDYKFNYNNDFEFVDSKNHQLIYINGVFDRELNQHMIHKLDVDNKLQKLTVKVDHEEASNYLFNYTNNRLDSYQIKMNGWPMPIEHYFDYNEQNQFIASYITLLDTEFTYEYKDNTISAVTVDDETINLSYDNKKNPFEKLPYEFTTLVNNLSFVFPLTYKFPHNMTGWESADGEDKVIIDYKYNEVNLPEKATFYSIINTERKVISEVTYTYQIQEIVKEKK